jgi:hypothetical protein
MKPVSLAEIVSAIRKEITDVSGDVWANLDPFKRRDELGRIAQAKAEDGEFGGMFINSEGLTGGSGDDFEIVYRSLRASTNCTYCIVGV